MTRPRIILARHEFIELVTLSIHRVQAVVDLGHIVLPDVLTTLGLDLAQRLVQVLMPRRERINALVGLVVALFQIHPRADDHRADHVQHL